MPELPDVELYRERLEALLHERALQRIELANPFVLRSVDPPIGVLQGRAVRGVERLGKRLVFRFEDEFFLVVHLMIAGRLRWRTPAQKPVAGRIVLARLLFEHGTLFLTEAGTQRRAMIHVVQGRESLAAFTRGGLEVLDATLDAFADRLRSENHTLKRSLTDPRLFSGIGNAYSDEILHRAQLSPLQLTQRMGDDDVARLFDATRTVLSEFLVRMRAETDGVPEQVTAFRPDMAVHGRFGQPCPACGAPVQRIRYASNETNYCARCQTGGRVLADRAMSRLLKDDWPRSIDEIE